MNNYYYNQDKGLLVFLDDNYKPVSGLSGNIARRRYNEIRAKKMNYTDIREELELCKSILLKSPELPPEVRFEYQKKYRALKKALDQSQTELLTHKN